MLVKGRADVRMWVGCCRVGFEIDLGVGASVLRDEQIEDAHLVLLDGRDASQREARWRSTCFDGTWWLMADFEREKT